MLSDVDLFLEGLQFVLSDCLWEGLSCVGKVPEKQIREEKSTQKKNHFSLAVPIQHTVDAKYSKSFLALGTLACCDAHR